MTVYSEDCCWNDIRDRCPIKREPCSCACHLKDDEIQVAIHGKYGQGPMPVEFRDALVEIVRLVKKAIDDGTLPKRKRRAAKRTGFRFVWMGDHPGLRVTRLA